MCLNRAQISCAFVRSWLEFGLCSCAAQLCMAADEGQIDLTAEPAISFAAAQAEARKENGRVRQLGKKAAAYWQWLSYEAVLVDATDQTGVVMLRCSRGTCLC